MQALLDGERTVQLASHTVTCSRNPAYPPVGGGGGGLEAATTLQMKAITSPKTRNTACTGTKHAPSARAISAVFLRHAGDALLP